MILTRTFKSGRSQAIRVPKEYRFSEEDVYMNKIDGVLLVVPKDKIWKVFDSSLEKFSADFMETRGEEVPDTRETL